MYNYCKMQMYYFCSSSQPIKSLSHEAYVIDRRDKELVCQSVSLLGTACNLVMHYFALAADTTQYH